LHLINTRPDEITGWLAALISRFEGSRFRGLVQGLGLAEQGLFFYVDPPSSAKLVWGWGLGFGVWGFWF
jgi:hypothetical protein